MFGAVKCERRSCVKEMDEVVILNDCQSFVDLCLNNVAQLHSAAATCKVMQELNISSPPSDWVCVHIISSLYVVAACFVFIL